MSTEAPKIVDDMKKLAWYEKLFAKFKMEVKDFSDDAALDQPSKGDVGVVAKEKGGAAAEAPKKGDEQTKETVTKETLDTGIEATVKVANAEAKNDASEAAKEVAALKSEIESLKSQLEAAQKLIKDHESKAVISDHKSFCENLIKEGKLRPADLEQTLQNFEARTYIDQIRNYASEGKPSAIEQLKKHLSSMPKFVEFSEVAVPPISSPEIPVPTAEGLDAYMEKAIKDKLASTPNTSYLDALKHCVKELGEKHPEMYKEYTARWLGR